MHFDAFSDMNQNSAQIESICVKVQENASKCFKMHQNVSKCKQNERCKCFVHKIIKQVVFITYRLVKLTIFHAKIGYFVPSAQNASICIRMHQNASECVQNEMCKCFVHENIKKWVYIAFKGAKISKILATLCDGRPCMSLKKQTLP